MIVIVDAGSTKTDWVVLDANFEVLFQIQTIGLNPSMHNQEFLTDEISTIHQLKKISLEVQQIYFYGAGCGSLEKKELMKGVLQVLFINAAITVHEDMLGAVYATSGMSESIVCILGTGSNSCYFDGISIQKHTPSLGYVIMDEASGNYFGKKIIRDYFYNKMPSKIATSFQQTYNLDTNTILSNLYYEDSPNKYLASFAKLLIDFQEEPYVQKIVKKGIKKFFKHHVLPFNKPNVPISFIGSIAFSFQEIIKDVATVNKFTVAKVIKQPIEGLIAFHRKAYVQSKISNTRSNPIALDPLINK